MDMMIHLETAVDQLISRNQSLQHEHDQLLQEKQAWIEERRELVAEIDRILARIQTPGMEDS